MKKTLSILVVALLLIAPIAVLAETHTSEAVGIAFEIPEGMAVVEGVNEATGLPQVGVSDGALTFLVIAGQMDSLGGFDLASATEEEIEQLIAALGLNAPEGESPVACELSGDDGEEPYLSLSHEDGTGYGTLEISSGYVFVQLVGNVSGTPLTDEELSAFDSFVESIEYLEGGGEDAEEEA